MRRTIDTKGNVVMVREESDDLIATLEQENRQLHARNQRLEQELEIANNNGVNELRDKLELKDEDRFKAFRMAVNLVGKCFKPGSTTKGVLLVETDDKVNIVSMNADISDVIEMTGASCERMLEVVGDIDNEDRVLN